jgi:tetratricopeptide (TPR) repeat protein
MDVSLPAPLHQALQGAADRIRAGDTPAATGLLGPLLPALPFPRWYELGSALHDRGAWAEAEAVFRTLAQTGAAPGPVGLMLGAVLVGAGRPGEAVPVLELALAATAGDRKLEAALRLNLGLALRRQRQDAQALAQYDHALGLDPDLPGLALHRAEALQNLSRHDAALAVLEDALAKAPGDAVLHHHYNDLLYRLGRDDSFLQSYERGPRSRDLLLGKARFLAQSKRPAEALTVYRALLAADDTDLAARAGLAQTLSDLGHHGEAAAAFDTALLQRSDAALFAQAAQNALAMGDPQKATHLCGQGLARAPYHALSLAVLSSAWRLMEDERHEALNGYDTLVQVFDLEPPDGFSSMADFNAALDGELDRLHPRTREFINQTLRGGTQTPDQLFATGLPLVARLKQRIDQAVARYIAGLAHDDNHPLLARRKRDFGYAGSWSSRLRDCGFHVNHIHSDGWISSCYYVAVPGAVRDAEARQGWIKFGEPPQEIGLKQPVRRAIQPEAGRLVLFPSYLWHGTIAFRDTAARTTIAFDVVPQP